MSLSLSEQLTTQFYLWEFRGRGWQVWENNVELEPPFIPYYNFSHSVFNQHDDGRIPSVLNTLVDIFKNNKNNSAINEEYEEYLDLLIDIEPEPFNEITEIKEIVLTLSNDYQVIYEYAHQFLINLSICNYPVSFEIIGTAEFIKIQLACYKDDYHLIRQLINTYFQNIHIDIETNSLKDVIDYEKYTLVVDMALSQEFMRPIKIFNRYDPEPLLGFFSLLDSLKEDETVILQILFQSANSPWVDNIMNSLTSYDGSAFFMDAPEMLPLAKEKLRSPLFSAVCRIVCQSDDEDKVRDITKSLCQSFGIYERSQSNELIPLDNDDYDNNTHLKDVILRKTHRSGMLLSSEELLGLIHIPSIPMSISKLQRELRKTKKLPIVALDNDYILGENIHRNVKNIVSLSYEQRYRHTYVVGATGTGKSTLLLNLIIQDIEHNNGLCVIDPHGELIEHILKYIPEQRFSDVILFDPGDTNYPIGINILEANTEVEKNVLSSDLVSIFRRFASSWGDQMTTILGNAISAFLESDKVGTLQDLKQFLLDKDFRNDFLKHVTDNEIRSFWVKQFNIIKGNALSSILTRLDTFLRPKIIRNIVGQKKGLNFSEILNTKKIFLVKLAQGIIGDENAYLLGSLIVAKLQQAVMSRQTIPESQRNPFFLYLDEFQNFISPSMSAILSGARKYNLGLILAHQELRQLWDKDTSLANSVISNPYTRICFRLGDFDAQKLQGGFSSFDNNDLLNLSIGEAIARIERADYDFNLKTSLPKKVDNNIAQKNIEAIKQLSRTKYGHELIIGETEIIEEETESVELTETVGTTDIAVTTDSELLLEPIPKVQDIIVEDKTKEKKEESTHKYLQTLIKKMAEQRGFKAIIEAPVLNNTGRVDVSLEREDKKIAVEISVTTNKEHEFNNIKKCIEADYDNVVLCSVDKKHLQTIQKYVKDNLEEENFSKVLFFQPEELFSYIDDNTSQPKTKQDKRVKGYRIKVNYKEVSEEQKEAKEKAVTDVILKAIKRMKEK